MSRLVLVFIFIFVLFAPLQGRAAPELPPAPTTYLSFEAVADMVRTYDDLYKRIPPEAFPRIETVEDVERWIEEIVPYFAYENIVNPDADYDTPTGVRFPTNVEFVYFPDAHYHVHVLGRVNCMNSRLELNARYENTTSTFFAYNNLLMVLVHELAHVQGICFSGGRVDSEMSAQLVTLEVLASLANHGSIPATVSLIQTLRSMTLASAWYVAHRDGREDDLYELYEEVFASPYEWAAMEKSRRYWKGDEDRLAYILEAYNYKPILEIHQARERGTCSFVDITMDPDTFDILRSPVHMDVPCINDVNLPINSYVFLRPLFIDDLDYFLDNAEDFVYYIEGHAERLSLV